MYIDFFKLKEHPFQITPDSDFLYMSEAHARAKAYMDYTICNKDGFVVITGEVGAGKTTLIRKLLSEFDSNVLVAKIFQTQLNETEFLQAVLVEFGLNPFKAQKVELMDMLTTFLIESFLQKKQLVLIVDEAQNLSPRVLEEIRMLSGLETEKQKILHVILVGQPELNTTLDSPELEQLLQRVRLRFHIAALTETETRDYIAHRLHIAGSQNVRIFADDTTSLIFQYSGGIPRLINTLCDTAMMCAFADDSPAVSLQTVKTAIEELQWQPFSLRVKKQESKQREIKEISSDPVSSNEQPVLTLSGHDLGQLISVASSIANRAENIELLLQHAVTLLQRKNQKISVKLGRAQVSQLMKQLTVQIEKNQIDASI